MLPLCHCGPLTDYIQQCMKFSCSCLKVAVLYPTTHRGDSHSVDCQMNDCVFLYVPYDLDPVGDSILLKLMLKRAISKAKIINGLSKLPGL